MSALTSEQLTEWFTTIWGDGITFPFVEDDACNIHGYGHQDKAAFAAAINRYDAICNGEPFPEDEQWDESHITHCWAVMDNDNDERFWVRKDEQPVTADTPGAFPITTMWGLR